MSENSTPPPAPTHVAPPPGAPTDATQAPAIVADAEKPQHREATINDVRYALQFAAKFIEGTAGPAAVSDHIRAALRVLDEVLGGDEPAVDPAG